MGKKKNEKEHCAHLNTQGEMMESIPTDPLGMYTGIPADIDERPIQDADDL